MKIIKKFILLIPFFAFSLQSQTIKNTLRISGKVREGKEKLENVKITLLADGEEVKSLNTPGNGRFVFELPLERNYFLVFYKDGYRSKHVNIYAEHIPEADAAFGFEFGGLDVSLFKPTKGLSDEVLDHPVAEIVYDTNIYKFVFNATYFEEIQEQIDSLDKQLVTLSEDPEKLAQLQEEAKIEEAKERQELENQKKKALAAVEVEKRKEKVKEPVREEPLALNTVPEKKVIEKQPVIVKQEPPVEVKKEEIKEIPKVEKPTPITTPNKEKELKMPVVEQKKVEQPVKKEVLIKEEKTEIAKVEPPKVKKEEPAPVKAKPTVSKEVKPIREIKAKSEMEAKPEQKIIAKAEAGVQKEVFRQGNKTITKLVISDAGINAEYRKVVADWGGRYFFKDDQPITEATWDADVSRYIDR